MTVKPLIRALRLGARLDNPTGSAWYGVAAGIGGAIISGVSVFAATRGWISESIPLGDAVMLVGVVVVPLLGGVVAQAASHDAVGIPSRVDRVQRPEMSPDNGDPNEQPRSSDFGVDDALGNFRDE